MGFIYRKKDRVTSKQISVINFILKKDAIECIEKDISECLNSIQNSTVKKLTNGRYIALEYNNEKGEAAGHYYSVTEENTIPFQISFVDKPGDKECFVEEFVKGDFSKI